MGDHCSKYITSTNDPRRLGYAHSGEEAEEGGDPVAVHMLSMLRDMRARSVWCGIAMTAAINST